MGYRAYHKETTRYLCFHPGTKTNISHFRTAAAAKAAITREAKRGAIKAEDFAVMEDSEFQKIEKTHIVKNKLSGKDVVESVNTPYSCSVASDAFHQS